MDYIVWTKRIHTVELYCTGNIATVCCPCIFVKLKTHVVSVGSRIVFKLHARECKPQYSFLGGRIMKLQNITDVDKFFEVINSCKGKVEIVSNEGDRLNIKSKLTQFVAMSKIFNDPIIKDLELVAYDPEDVEKLIRFMMQG